MMALIADHLWQTTACGLAIWIVCAALRHHRAALRFWLWAAASLKFVLPFAALMYIGQHIPWTSHAHTSRPVVAAVTKASQPFSHPAGELAATFAAARPGSTASNTVPAAAELVVAIWTAGCLLVLARWIVRRRALRQWLGDAVPQMAGREWDALQRARHLVPALPALVVSDTPVEPGLIGIRRPVLLWPRRLTDRLSDEQMDAIVAHELCHLARRDNVAAMAHVVIQAVFWFHPLTWLIGRRLIDERERACDEFVLGLGNQPVVYADSILKTCTVCIELPVATASGVTGSELKQRIRDIVGGAHGRTLGTWGRLLLAACAALVVCAPLVIGAQTPAPAAAFEVASIKPNNSGERMQRIGLGRGGRVDATNVSAHQLVLMAYGLRDFQVSGEPGWMNQDRYDLAAIAPHEIQPDPSVQGPPVELQEMMQGLLSERFKFAAHLETRQLPVYVLTQSKAGQLGPKLQTADVDCRALMAKVAANGGPPPSGKPGEVGPCSTRVNAGTINARSVTMTGLARTLSNQVGRVINDETGLAGAFDFDLEWAPDQNPDAVGASLFTAIQEQLGLKLTATKGPVDVLVIDHVEKPTPD